VKGEMMRATLLAATLAMAILMVTGCGQEGAGQESRHESTAEPKPTPQAKQGQPKKPQTGKGVLEIEKLVLCLSGYNILVGFGPSSRRYGPLDRVA
jgi:hypothetical protein